MIITLVKYENGGKIDAYDLVNQKASDFKNVFACCEYFAQQGKYVWNCSIKRKRADKNASPLLSKPRAQYRRRRNTSFFDKKNIFQKKYDLFLK